MSCARACSAASATRPRAVSCIVGCRWAWCAGEADGEVLLHPDESVTAAIRAVFERFAEMGSARRVWLWFRSQGLRFPLQSNQRSRMYAGSTPTYTKIHQVLTNPFYAGVYVYGRTQQTVTSMTAGACASASSCAPAPSGPCSSATITAASSTGRPSRPTRSASRTIPVQRPHQQRRRRERRSSVAARHRRVRTLRASPGACITAADTPRPGITAPARTSSMAEASIA